MTTGGLLCVVGGHVEAWAHLPAALHQALQGSTRRELRVEWDADTELSMREVRDGTLEDVDAGTDCARQQNEENSACQSVRLVLFVL